MVDYPMVQFADVSFPLNSRPLLRFDKCVFACRPFPGQEGDGVEQLLLQFRSVTPVAWCAKLKESAMRQVSPRSLAWVGGPECLKVLES